MDTKNFLFLAVFCLFSSTCFAFNITKILSEYPDFSNFNDLLSRTGIAKDINSRQTITVLAVSNGAVGGLSGKPTEIAKRILSSHVILDYYDQIKLGKLPKKSVVLTTLYQTTGTADDQQGFLNCTKTVNGIMFGSASKGAPLTASLLGSVASQPYNISVLQVSSVIQAPGIDKMAPPPRHSPPKAPASAPSPSPDSDEAPAPSKKHSKAPKSAEAPDADSSTSSPPEPDSPASDGSPAPAPETTSDSSRAQVGVASMVMVLVACMMMGF